ncbi:MAG: beta-glucosidase, partial [Bacteroides sp.]
MKKIYIMLTIATVCSGSASNKELYKDASAPIEQRVENLLEQMTLEEKVGQMNQFVGVEHIKSVSTLLTEADLKNNSALAYYPNTSVEAIEKWTAQGLIGSFLHVLTVKEANYLQGLSMKSRLQIPLL